MCGICGIAIRHGERLDPSLITTMRDTMTHRGPDDAGVEILADGQIGLGHRRLSILDLSAAGHQPMTNEDGRVWISYNGEVYNHADIRRTLESKGHTFRSRTDTEVLVHLYEELGADMVHRLRGMFAFALWDGRSRTLLLARDRLGIKPLFYAETSDALIFASEIKAIFASGLVRPNLDQSRVPEYLSHGRVLPPHTLFESVKKLEPGHILEYGPDKVVRRSQYWDLFDGVDRTETARWTEQETTAALLRALRESVELRLMSDVPVGVFLSAGVDSSTVAAMVAEAGKVPLKTFTVGFEGSEVHNEVEEARSIALMLGSEHHDIKVGPRDVKNLLPLYLDYMEEPNGNPVWTAIYLVSMLAREHGVVVALTGDGGDELFVGYDKWMRIIRLRRHGWSTVERLPAPLRKGIASVGGILAHGRVATDLLRAMADGEELFQGGTAFRQHEIMRFVRADLLERAGRLSSYASIAHHRQRFLRCAPNPSDYADWMTYLSLKSGLLEDYLMRLDKMGMAASLEGRVPLLDHEFVRLTMSIRGSAKHSHGQRKRLLKNVARQVLPAAIVDTPKRGFNAPVEDWIVGDLAQRAAEGVTSFAQRTGVLTAAGVRQLQDDARLGPAQAAARWGLMSLALWHDHWIASA